MKKPVLGGGRGRTSGPARPVGAAAHASGSARQAESPGPAAGSANQGESSGEEGELIEAVVIDVEGDEAEHGEKHLRWGDRSLLWRLPGTAGTDRWSTRLVDRLTGVSLLLARLASDGSWARAMFGSGGFALWGIGLILGLLSAVQVGFMA
mgnify:FL=1